MKLAKEFLVDCHLQCDEKFNQFAEKVKFDCNISINLGLFQSSDSKEDSFYDSEAVIEGFNGTDFYYTDEYKEEIRLVNFQGLSLDEKIHLIEEYLSSKK